MQRRSTLARQIVFALIAGVVVYFFVIKALEAIARVPWDTVQLSVLPLLLSLVLLVIGYLLLAFNWREVLLSLGQNIRLSDGIFAWTASQFGKYVPGTIWFAVGRSYLAKQKGVSNFHSGLSTVVESILMSVAALALGLLATTTLAADVTGIVLYVVLAAAGLALLYPPILRFIVTRVAKRFKITQPIQLRFKELYLLFVNYALAWLLIGFGFFFMLKSLGLDAPVLSGGSFVLAWAIGFLAVFVPGGLGVREAALVVLLTPALGQPLAVLAAIVSRFWWIAGELLATLVSLGLRRVAAYLKSERVQNVPGNFFNKYGTKNPIERWLVGRYFTTLYKLVGESAGADKSDSPVTLLDIGCGEGVVDKKLLEKFNLKIRGLDLEQEVIDKARKLNPSVQYDVASVLEIPAGDGSYDVALCGEVMEHLYEPEKAARELRRVARIVIVSVPREPIWRIGNMARGKYWRALGNTPGHVQNFSPKELRNLLEKYFAQVETRTAGMWTMAICRVAPSQTQPS